MTYPTISPRAADEVAASILVAGSSGSGLERLEEDYCSGTNGPSYDRYGMNEVAAAAQDAWLDEVARRGATGPEFDLYLLEAFMAGRVHQVVKDLPIALREDFGFWRYLALFPFRWYLQLREPELQPQDYGGTKIVRENPERRSPTSPAYQLLLRTYLWGKIAFDPDEDHPYRRATLVNDTGGATTDVWHSHLVRIQLGQLGDMPHAFLDSICAGPKANTRDPARKVEKRITRMKHNVLFDVYDIAGARVLADEQKALGLEEVAGEG